MYARQRDDVIVPLSHSVCILILDSPVHRRLQVSRYYRFTEIRSSRCLDGVGNLQLCIIITACRHVILPACLIVSWQPRKLRHPPHGEISTRSLLIHTYQMIKSFHLSKYAIAEFLHPAVDRVRE